MRRPATAFPALLLALTLASPGTAQGQGFLTATTETVSAASGGVIGYSIVFANAPARLNYILLMSYTGTTGFDFGTLHVPLSLDALVIHTFFADIGSRVLQSGFRDRVAGPGHALLGFPPGLLTPLVGMTFHLAALGSGDFALPFSATNTVKLVILP